MTTSSRGRVRVVRNPLNVMARLAEVVGGNGTRGKLRCARLGVSGPECSHGWNGVLETSNRKSKTGNGLRDLECLNDEDLNESNIAMRRVNERSGDSAT
ncbi:hypothetical protein CRG98_042442 [Punica granatum]|uniref:Uncharacterized protein n=1 Tax=Punica granatum TaxID=22663 RepID=A0A2I0HZP0_PUNGR|nr:hypothetical protein CRG98_042442 [Punica granatum]